MHSIKSLVNRGRAKIVAASSFLVLSVGAAMAQTTGGGGVDYGTAIDGFKTDMTSFFTTNGGKLLGILVVVLGFGLVWKLLKKGAKSV